MPRSYRTAHHSQDAEKGKSGKTCTKCKQFKAPASFNKEIRGVLGLRAICRECQTIHHREWLFKVKNNIPRPKKSRYDKYLNAVRCANRRAILYGCKDKLNLYDVLRIMRLYDETCIKCGFKKVTIDHVIPLSKGGPNNFCNLQILCVSCNSYKARTTQDYRYEAINPS